MLPPAQPNEPKPRDNPPVRWGEDYPVEEPTWERFPEDMPLPNPDEMRAPTHYFLH